ncbi:methyl-accepting chemotaxis protein, partial [Campylobacter jejuni]|nr:methyl-accepting chemotaxis protein [Campylobacter jejuni]MBC5861596.1 methyl-accepting chemotaxis protein [Campylobacter jejuni]
MFKNFQLGTKIIFVVLSSVFVVLLVLATLISFQSYKTLNRETNLLIANVNARGANKVQGYVNQDASTVNFAVSRMESTLGRVALGEDQMKDVIESLSSTSNFIEYAYIIGINSQAFIAQNGKSFTMDSKLKSDLLANTSPSAKGKIGISRPFKVQIQNKDFTTLNFTIDIFNPANQKVATLGILYNLTFLGRDLLSQRYSFFKGDKRFLITQDGTIVIHPNKEFIGKNIKEINTDPSVQKIIADSMNKTREIFDYKFLGIDYTASIQPVEIVDSDAIFMMLSMAPNEAVYESFYNSLYTIIICSVASMVIIALIVFLYVKFFITQNIHSTLKYLLSFFDYINHKTKNVSTIEVKSNDEFGQMSKIINENILATKKGLEQDNQ